MKYGIIGAMEPEVVLLKESMCVDEVTTVAGMDFHDGTMGYMNCTVVRSGVGKVNAALCVQILVDKFGVDAIINTGVAGSLDNMLNIGDMVISTSAVQHDVDASVFGYALGQIPGLPSAFFEADGELADRFLTSVNESDADVQAVHGIIASGDVFVADPMLKLSIRETFGASCAEMEGASIAQASTLNNVPFVIVRVISDKADGSDVMEYTEFEEKAAHICANAVLKLAGVGTTV